MTQAVLAPDNQALELPTPNGEGAAPVIWRESWDDETIKLAHDASTGMLATHYGLADAADRKTLGLFGVASILVTVAPALNWGRDIKGWAAFWAIIALLSCRSRSVVLCGIPTKHVSH
jgi:hypothetical protein